MAGFTDLLTLIQLEVKVYHNAKVCGNWVIKEHEIGQTCFHMPTTGKCLLSIPNKSDVILNQGDLVIFPNEIEHTMTHLDELAGPQSHEPYTSSKPGVGMLCGKVTFNHKASDQLLKALPEVFVIPFKENTLWLSNILEMIQYESYHETQGSSDIINKLSELLFTYALRHYYFNNPQRKSIIALYVHTKLSRAIDAIHKNIKHNWTLSELAPHALMSRTSFATTFKQVSNLTPMEYITWWRMQLAWNDLISGDSIFTVADSIGYKSEAAFAKAFKRHFQRTPGSLKNLKQ